MLAGNLSAVFFRVGELGLFGAADIGEISDNDGDV